MRRPHQTKSMMGRGKDQRIAPCKRRGQDGRTRATLCNAAPTEVANPLNRGDLRNSSSTALFGTICATACSEVGPDHHRAEQELIVNDDGNCHRDARLSDGR